MRAQSGVGCLPNNVPCCCADPPLVQPAHSRMCPGSLQNFGVADVPKIGLRWQVPRQQIRPGMAPTLFGKPRWLWRQMLRPRLDIEFDESCHRRKSGFRISLLLVRTGGAFSSKPKDRHCSAVEPLCQISPTSTTLSGITRGSNARAEFI